MPEGGHGAVGAVERGSLPRSDRRMVTQSGEYFGGQVFQARAAVHQQHLGDGGVQLVLGIALRGLVTQSFSTAITAATPSTDVPVQGAQDLRFGLCHQLEGGPAVRPYVRSRRRRPS